MSLTLIACSVVACSSIGAPNTHARTNRDMLLATPAPYPAGRTDDPSREEIGRLWHSRSPVGSRTPIAEQVYGRPGAAAYGASVHSWDDLMWVRVNHQIIAASPWVSYAEDGLDQYRDAQHQWLREQGYILTVRTHVNSRFMYEQSARAEKVEPSAVIHIRERYRRGGAQREASATPSRVIRVIRPEETKQVETASAATTDESSEG